METAPLVFQHCFSSGRRRRGSIRTMEVTSDAPTAMAAAVAAVCSPTWENMG